MQDLVLGFLTFLCCLKGLTCSKWSINSQPQVNGSLGQNVILPCSFTHPKQDTYTGIISVMWMQENKKEPVFQCSLSNKTNSQDGNCTQRPSKRFWLHGNPRKRDLSLAISNLQLSDGAKYACRLILDYEKAQRATELIVHAPARILILSQYLELTSHAMLVKCIAQGNPVPDVKWTLSSGQNVSATTERHKYMVMSSVQFSEQDVYTCQAVNSLARAQKTFPPDPRSCSAPLVATGVLASVLALGLLLFIWNLIRKRQSERGAMENYLGAQQVKSSIYEANETVYANVRTLPPDASAQDKMYSTWPPSEEARAEVNPRFQSQRRATKVHPATAPTAPVESDR
ncbi:sialic acid binding Ig-like lectin 15, like isoform X2 [Danio aesculapii]|nr:sialic acid binding Ig-like lectin 15, like isoform X2 [Danio aesculapii]